MNDPSCICLEMYNQNSDHKILRTPSTSPRISFSNDFMESSHNSQQKMSSAAYKDAPVSSDFQFSVSNYSMMSTADQLLFRGSLLPFKGKTTTLRDELQKNEEDDYDDFTFRPPKNPTRLRGFLGLKKSDVGSKKSVKADDHVQCSKTSQDYVE